MYCIHKWQNKGNLDKNEVLKAISRDKRWCADKTNGVWTTYSLSCCSVGNMPSTRVDRQQINKLSGSAKYRTLKWLILSIWEAWVRVHVYQKLPVITGTLYRVSIGDGAWAETRGTLVVYGYQTVEKPTRSRWVPASSCTSRLWRESWAKRGSAKPHPWRCH